MHHIPINSYDEYYYKNFMGKLFKYVKESEYKAIGLDSPILPFADLFYLDCINRNFKNCISSKVSRTRNHWGKFFSKTNG